FTSSTASPSPRSTSSGRRPSTAASTRTSSSAASSPSSSVDYIGCHSLDYCDAPELMHAAFVEVLGREPDFRLEGDRELWKEAWAIARRPTSSPEVAKNRDRGCRGRVRPRQTLGLARRVGGVGLALCLQHLESL